MILKVIPSLILTNVISDGVTIYRWEVKKKSQIYKIENILTDVRFDTILKLNAKINFNVELLNEELNIA